MDLTKLTLPLSVCSQCEVVPVIGRFARPIFERARARGGEHPNVSRGSTSHSVEESRTGKPQWCILRNWEFRKFSIPAYLTWSGVLPKTSGVIAQNVVFVEQETP